MIIILMTDQTEDFIHVSEPEAAFAAARQQLDIYFPFISINKWVKTEHKSV